MLTMKATKSLMENGYFSLFSVIAMCHLHYYSLTSTHNGLNIHTWKGKAIPVSDQRDMQMFRWMEVKLHSFFTLTLKWVISFTLQSLGGPLKTLWSGGWTVSRVGLDVLVTKSPSCDENQIPHFQPIHTYLWLI